MVYNRIEELVKKHGITIARLERESGLGNGVISKWKVSSPNLESLMKVAEYFDTNLDDLTTSRNEFKEQ